MDANKREKLIEMGYQILPTCGTCVFFKTFSADLFGTCDINTYEHEKHSKKDREVSVCRYGTCSDHVLAPDVSVRLHGFTEFIS